MLQIYYSYLVTNFFYMVASDQSFYFYPRIETYYVRRDFLKELC